MTELSDRLNAAAGGTSAQPSASPAASEPEPAQPQSLTDKLNAAANAPKAPPSTAINAPDTGNSFWYDLIHPQAADLSRPQTWRDWATKTYSPTAADFGRAATDDVSFGTADYGQSKLTGEDVERIRARTAASQAALGPMGPVVNALTYVIPGTGEMKAVAPPGKALGWAARKAAPYVGRYGAAAAEGATASGLSSAGHQLGDPEGIDWEKVTEDSTKGAVFGVGGQAVGRGLQRVADTGPVRRVADYVSGNPGRGADPYFGDIRARSNAGADVGQDIQNIRSTIQPGAATRPGLDAAYNASQQSIEPGPIGNVASYVAGKGARVANYKLFGWPGVLMGDPGPMAENWVLDRARSSNAGARNQAIQNALDQTVQQATDDR